MPLVLHITPRWRWEEAQRSGVYRSETLDTQGFIHCSTPRQVTRVADHIFLGRTDLVLPCVEPEKLSHDLRCEALESAKRFPRVYGPVNLDAVRKVLACPLGLDSRFSLSERLSRE